MSKRLAAGHVAQVRINPKDCMSVIDVVKTAGVWTEGMSFAQMVSLALSSAMETFRQSKFIPERDGFEYLEMMERYMGESKSTKKKQQITQVINAAGATIHARGLARPTEEAIEDVTPEPSVSVDGGQTGYSREDTQRFTELLQKKEMAEDKIPGVLWSESDEQEYHRLYKLIYPEG